MKKLKTILIIIVVIALAILTTIAYRADIENNNMEKSAATIAECSIEMKEDNMVLVKFNNQAGIKEIKYPSGDVITCNGKKSIGVDLKVSKNGKYEYTLKDINNVEKKYTVYAPGVHVELTRNDIDIDLENAKNIIRNNLINNLVVTNFVNINIVVGDREIINTETTEMNKVFNTWNKFGDGDWSYKNGEIKNSKNTNYITGYYSPENNYTDITVSFKAQSTDNDDDMIGCMARYDGYNKGYIFWASGGGKAAGNTKKEPLGIKYNGILKAENIRHIYDDKTGNNILSCANLLSHTDWVWSKKVWNEYKIKISGKKIEGYIDGNLKVQTQDNSYVRGAYGFITLSQPAKFWNIKIDTIKALTLQEIIAKTNWKTDEINIIVNFNNQKEQELATQACVNAFNSKGIHYEQVTTSANASYVNTFLSKIGNRGRYVESSNYNTYMSQLTDYITTYVRNNTK